MIHKHIKYISILALFFSLLSCSSEKQQAEVHPDFETSYWIDIDLARHSVRGYWEPVDSLQPEAAPDSASIANATRLLAQEYGADKLYIVYHRQYEIDDAKRSFELWQQEGRRNNVTIVPTIVLEDYSKCQMMNFSDSLIIDFASWCNDNINADELGIYDVYIRQDSMSRQDRQMKLIKESIGNKLIRVGLQPGEKLNAHCKGGVEDTWTAECQGLTDQLWSSPDSINGTDLYGRKLLASWVAERAQSGDSRRIVWDMIPVAWDYDDPVDPLGYVCPGDDALINDPPLPGRIALCHDCIVEGYDNGMMNTTFGGYSCDLHILQANSAGCSDTPTFYEQLACGELYTGYFADAMKQVSELYKQIAAQKTE